jgi:predicted Zn-dependent protease
VKGGLAVFGLMAIAAPGWPGTQGPPRPPAAKKSVALRTFEQITHEADAARKDGRLADAADLFREALGLKPDWLDGQWALATLLYDLDRFGEARDHFRRVVEARPDDGVAVALLALCGVRLGDYEKALVGLQRARDLGVANAEVRAVAAFQLALLLNRSGNPEMALEILRGLAVQGRDDPAVIVAFGLATLRLRSMPADVPAERLEMIRLAGRGGYHMARGRRTEIGRLALEELVSRYPTEPNVHYALALYIAPEDPDAAIAELRKELAREPEHIPALVQVSALELKRGNVAAALPTAEDASRLAPNVPATCLVLGNALLDAGEPVRAVHALEKGATLAPESREIQFALARAYQRSGRSADAERARQEFLRLDRAAREREAGSAGEDARPQERPQGTSPGSGA